MKIRVESLRKSYHDVTNQLVVLNDLTYEFNPGQSYAIIGRSGIGKSTLLHLLGGLDRPTSGRVFYDDVNLYELSSDELAILRGGKVGFIFQFHHLLPEFSALENIAMPLTIKGIGDEHAFERAEQLIKSVGLGQRSRHRPSELSGGEQQRVAIARALVSSPNVILADEPTGNLDFNTASEVQELLLEVCRSNGTTLVVVTHNKELSKVLDTALEMAPGGELREV